MSEEQLREKKESLLKEIGKRVQHENFWGDQNRRASMGLLGIAIPAHQHRRRDFGLTRLPL
jgi:hypothetical protein